MEVLIEGVDPFTTQDIEIALSQVSEQTGGQISKAECRDLFKEFILEPQKSKKSKNYKEFSESKKRFDLTWNREDIEQEDLIKSRFQIYNSYIPVSTHTTEILQFLSQIKSIPSSSHRERRDIIQKARELSQAPVQQFQSLKTLSRQIGADVIKLNSSFETDLADSEKVILLRAIQKHMGDWDKILKEFKEKSPNLVTLKQTWRCLKATMREEVREIKKRWPQYHYIKWLRAAVRKLEQSNGRRLKNKPPPIIDATQSEKRIDILDMMADADKNYPKCFQDNSGLLISTSSSFKKFDKSSLTPDKEVSIFGLIPIMIGADSNDKS